MIRSKRWMIVFLLFSISMLATFTGISFGQKTNLKPPSADVPASLFGMHIHHAATTSFRNAARITPWPTVPFATWRLWDAYVTWPNLEPRKGEWHFETLDQCLDLADQHQVEILLTLGQSPRWASARPTDKSSYSSGWSAEPKNIEDWRNYVRQVATRYKGRIKYYEIWNEPNFKSFYSGSVEQMVALSREAYQVLKEVDPLITVVSPSATGGEKVEANSGNTGGPYWLADYLSKGGGDYADVIGYHFYVIPQPPEAMEPLINTVQKVIAKYKLDHKPLWNTEAGWSKPKTFSSDEEAAAYVARSYILNWAAGVSRFYWYSWDNHWWVNLYMTKLDSKTPTLAATAYSEVQKWLLGKRMTACEANSQKTWTCQLTDEGRYSAWIVWNPERKLAFAVPKAWGVQQVRNLAGTKPDRSLLSSVEIGPSPLLFERVTQ